MHSLVRVSADDFDVGAECDALRALSRRSGAIAQFVGVMRDSNQGDDVLTMELEHYPGMTERRISEIIERAAARWPILAATVIHRVGLLHPQDQIVFVGVSAGHRHDAFQACEFIMDFLKTEAPFWKKERTPSGERWVDARDTDQQALARWQTEKA
ncbi:MAG: molybdopterin synthase catalytic subunit MoaE [Zhongshania sp.]|uniref:molybdopterin synthase catalytic subunit MoaE n=1 Tax=Zhongshania sp. TaxID=1971902 RepID=UPI00263201F7|nr:molybdopterin synthase catalytic subunit MoaE [Zhongshania sp.]MDF1691789.1 molybdopterin synthase catalytic subunit MoaE [Zhongshania sp.]